MPSPRRDLETPGRGLRRERQGPLGRFAAWLFGRKRRPAVGPAQRRLRWELQQARAATEALDELLEQARLEFDDEHHHRRGAEQTVVKLKRRLAELRRQVRDAKRAGSVGPGEMARVYRERKQLQRQRDRERARAAELEGLVVQAERRAGGAERYARELERRLQEVGAAVEHEAAVAVLEADEVGAR